MTDREKNDVTLKVITIFCWLLVTGYVNFSVLGLHSTRNRRPHSYIRLSRRYGYGMKALVWLIVTMVCLLAAPWVQLSVSAGNGWPHNALRHHWLMPISCHFRDCKALLVTSLTHVSGAIASVQTFTFTLYLCNCLKIFIFMACARQVTPL